MASTVSATAERHRQAQAWARQVGVTHDLGGCLGVFQAVHGRISARGCGIFLILASVLIGIPFAGVATGSVQVALACGDAAVFGGAIVLARVPPAVEKADLIGVFAGGVAQLKVGDAAPLVIPWQRLGHLYVSYLDPSDSDQGHSWALQQVTMRAVDGSEITATTVYTAHGLARLRDLLEEKVVALRLPGAVAQFDSGATLSFGHLSLSQRGITWKDGAKHAAWERIRSFEVEPHEFAVFTGRLFGPRIPQAGVPDWCVAIALLREVAARRGIPEQGRR